MTIYYSICFFILGMVLGSFYNVVGSRIPNGESILYPGSHCTNCNHKLMPWELIPVISFFLLRGKCSSCKQKISWVYPLFELFSGLLFMIAFLIFGLSLELIISLTFISLILIITISDFQYMIIPDSIIIFFFLLISVEIFFIRGSNSLLYGLFSALISFIVMFLIKKLGDFLFKKESMGGGDIKLLSIFGLTLGWPIALISIFVGALVGLPIALIICIKHNNHILPFGPLLGIGAIILLFTRIDIKQILDFFTIF
ncbi:MAG: prepilin peptidase [Clostridium sp.]|nr:prepilin peptidase [Clostridium sp.]MCM1444017.1 prepilin peptidase [Candidatus Amulumruptor caecigallinarius]